MPQPDHTALPTQPLRTTVRHAVEAAWDAAIASGELPDIEAAARPPVDIERPANAERGDLATSLALKLARPYRRAPLQIAETLAARLRAASGEGGTALFASVTAAAPGFVNVRMGDATLEAIVEGVLAAPAGWGRVAAPLPERVNVEFVSANPTGPLHIGNARGAFVGDLLCRVLDAAGHATTREYYFNDFGGQVQKLGASVRAIRLGRDVPEDGYRGAYVHDISREMPGDVAAAAEAAATGDGAEEAADWVVGRWASERVRAGIEASLRALVCGSTCGRPKARSMTRAGSRGPWSACAELAPSTSPKAPRGSAPRSTATTRIA